MKNLKRILFAAIAFFALQSFTIDRNSSIIEVCETDVITIDNYDSVDKYGATIRVHNRSRFPVRVIIGGRDRGFLRGNSFGNYGVHNGSYHVRTVWRNGDFLFWDVTICCGRVFNCFPN